MILTAYSFLAALTENKKDLYGTVFVPLCKRALSKVAKTAKVGSADDVKRVLNEEYGLNVPIAIVRNLIKRVAYNQTRREKTDFNLRVMENGDTFAFDNYNYATIEILYDEERRRANALEEAFHSYAESEGYDNTPSFQEFIDDNKHKLSAFFSGNYESLSEHSLEDGFLPHAKFLRKIESENQQLYKAAEKAYLGSLVAAYLEAGVDIDSRLERGVVYYIDTRVLLEAMDLQGPETTRPALDMLDLIRSTGGSARVLSITVQEISRILGKEIDNYSKSHPTTTIGDACARLKHNKAWLVAFKGNIEKTISETLSIPMDFISDSKVMEYAKSAEVNELVDIGYGKDNAIHDISACLAIREKRKVPSKIRPQKTNYWFVSANSKLSLFNKKHCNSIPEIVMPGELTSILFLKDPTRYSEIVSKQGLSAMIARTLTDEYADKDLINEFDVAIRKSSMKLSRDDYELLLEYVALESTSWLQRLIDESKDSQRFDNQVHSIVEKARNLKAEQGKIQKDEQEYRERIENERIQIESRNNDLKEKLERLEETVNQINQERSQLEEKHSRELRRSKRWLSFVIGISVAIVLILFCVFLPVKEALKIVFEGIAGLGGFWGFLNLLLNVIKTK